MVHAVFAAAMMLAAVLGARADAPQSAAFLGFTVIDNSLGASHDVEDARAAMLAGRLTAALAESGRYVFIDAAPIAAELARYANPSQCNGCDARMAAALGADVAVTAEVQKTSNLILHMSVYVRDAETGRLVAGGSADMRGNTDESWRRALDFILTRRILAPASSSGP